ncbi:hypothetical protein D3C80_596730 [compost metagenome]
MRQDNSHLALPRGAAAQCIAHFLRDAREFARLPVSFQANVDLVIVFPFLSVEIHRHRLSKPIGRQGIAAQVAVIKTELAADLLQLTVDRLHQQ